MQGMQVVTPGHDLTGVVKTAVFAPSGSSATEVIAFARNHGAVSPWGGGTFAVATPGADHPLMYTEGALQRMFTKH